MRLLLELRVAFNDLLDTILRHFPPRCPLPAGHKGDAIGGMVGDLAAQARRRWRY